MRVTPCGTSGFTAAKAEESVIIAFGCALSAASAAAMPAGWQQTGVQPRSSNSRITSTCGFISRPFGAEPSCGITSRTVSPVLQIPSVIYLVSVVTAAAMALSRVS